MSLELLSLGLDFMGGLMGHSSANRANKQNMAMFQQQQQQAQRQFDAQMDQSVTRRVKDAQNAGVHPLFALGASVGASPTIQAGSPPDANKGNPMGAALASMASTLGVIEQNRASAKRDEAEAQLLDSERKRIEQDLQQRGQSVSTHPYGAKLVHPDEQAVIGPAEYVPPQIPFSKRPGVAAGERPGIIEVRMPDGSVMELYDPDLGLDEIGQAKYVFDRALHYDRVASKWTKEFVKRQWNKFKGQWPKFTRSVSGPPIR